MTTLKLLAAPAWARIIPTNLWHGSHGSLWRVGILLLNCEHLVKWNLGLAAAIVVFAAEVAHLLAHADHPVGCRVIGERQTDVLDVFVLVNAVGVGDEKNLPLSVCFRRDI